MSSLVWTDINALNTLTQGRVYSAPALVAHGLIREHVTLAVAGGYLRILPDREALDAVIASFGDLARGCEAGDNFYEAISIPEAVEDPAVVAYREEMQAEAARQEAERLAEAERAAEENAKLAAEFAEQQAKDKAAADAQRKQEIADAVAAALAERAAK